jgi:hypothetical protein
MVGVEPMRTDWTSESVPRQDACDVIKLTVDNSIYLAWEQKYMAPIRAASSERVRRELPNVEIVNVPGTHMDFVFTSRDQVVGAMLRFLSESAA